jgi:hypothetical protein
MEHRLQLYPAMATFPFPPDECVLLVVEGSAACEHWPSHLGAPPDAGWSVLEQEEWEPLSGFLERLSNVTPMLAGGGERPVVALISSRFWDACSIDARRRLALDILAHLAQAGGGTLLLTHGHQHDALAREALTALAQELSPEWEESRVLVSTRFEERSRRTETRKPSNPALHTVAATT